VPWTEVFIVFLVSHLVGDFGFQTEWQAMHKHGGLGPDPEARRALISHIAAYTLAYVPALVWLAGDIGAGAALGTAALISFPHLVQDDGRLVWAWVRRVKGTDPIAHANVTLMVDQSFHLVALLLTALLVGT
jgi:Protein of unknown function (DUF3307)